MAILQSALFVFQSLFGLSSRKDRSQSGTDWLKLALAVASQPEDEESRSTVRIALQTNNQEFFDYLRSALDTRSAAAARVAEINGDGVECRAFLPGSPALWGWTTNTTAEAAVLQAGIEAAMESSVFDSPSGSSGSHSQDTFDGMTSPEMGGATLRDIYAKAWELHREPLIWTPRGPGAGVGASTWTLTPVSLTLPSAHTRTRRASDASDARSSVVGMSPCLFAQRNRGQRDSDVFTTDAKQKALASPFVETGLVTPPPSSSAAALPLLEFEPVSRPRRSASCTRSHVSSTTAVTVSECSTTQELPGLGLSFNGSNYSRPDTPSDICYGDNEMVTRMTTRDGKTLPRLLGSWTPGSAVSRQNGRCKTLVDNSKQLRLRRPGVNPLQRVQASISRRVLPNDLTRTPRTPGSDSHGPQIERIISGAYSRPPSSRGKCTPLRRVQSAAVMALSREAQIPRTVAHKVPLLGPVPATRQVKNYTNKTSMVDHGQNEPTPSKRGPYQTLRLVSTPTPQARPRVPSTSRIPRPASRATTYLDMDDSDSVRDSLVLESRQLPTPTSVTRTREQQCTKRAGGVIIGKTNCDEFGMGSLNTHSAFGPVTNPFDSGPARSAGGSSGGSAAAVAADLCFAALGTDTGGSIRLPAAYCGVVGFKPSYGMISRWGVVSYADSLDCVGILAKSVGDVELVYDVLSRYDPRDPTSAPEDLRQAANQKTATRIDKLSGSDRLDGVRIGIPQEYFPHELDPSSLVPFRTLLGSLRSLGAHLVSVSLPNTSYALSAYYVLASAEASSNLARYDGIRFGLRVDPERELSDGASAYKATRTAGFGREVKKRILLGTYALSADAFENYFLQAHRVRALVRSDFDRVFGKSVLASGDEAGIVDVLVHPSAIRTAPPLDSNPDALDAYVQDVLTVPASLAGLPALSVPCGHGPDGWPVGASIVGQWGFDQLVCRVGQQVQDCR
ncbi:Trimeric GatFAB AmidoTransferase(AdT) complex subunit [Ceratobasidium sp. 423]|nr:Trimeric GatFAB AmidoTransferase(AdT) complex subunit [Ceratobasidium sp. 423]